MINEEGALDWDAKPLETSFNLLIHTLYFEELKQILQPIVDNVPGYKWDKGLLYHGVAGVYKNTGTQIVLVVTYLGYFDKSFEEAVRSGVWIYDIGDGKFLEQYEADTDDMRFWLNQF